MKTKLLFLMALSAGILFGAEREEFGPLKFQQSSALKDVKMEIPALAAHQVMTLGFRLPENNASLVLEDAKLGTQFSIRRHNQDIFSLHFSAGGKVLNRGEHYLRGRFEESFGLPAGLLEWSRFLQFRLSSLDKRVMYLRVIATEKGHEYYVNGYYCGTASYPEKAPERKDGLKEYRLTLNKAELVSSFQSVNTGGQRDAFLPIDLTSKFNARLPFQAKTLPENSVIRTDGVPFLFLKGDENGNVLDLYYSYFRVGRLLDTEGFEFGGRWGGAWDAAAASQNNPSRFRFRVPSEDYTALYVLAATQKNIPDAINRFTVQFYRAGAGFPVNFVSPAVPELKEKGAGLDINGQTLHLIRVPLDPAKIRSIKDGHRNFLEFELTKDVYNYQTYPDPFYYSRHGMGLPSGVKIFAVTLERAPYSVEFEPVQTAAIWNAPETPEFTVELKANESAVLKKSLFPGKYKFNLTVTSYEGKPVQTLTEKASLDRDAKTAKVSFPVKVNRYGWYGVKLTVTDPDGKEVWSQDRSMVYLRERKPVDLPFDYPGIQFGFWNWNGGHGAFNGPGYMDIMGRMGMNAIGFGGERVNQSKAIYEAAKKWHLNSYWGGSMHPTHDYVKVMENEAKEKARQPKPEVAVNELAHPLLFAWGVEPAVDTGGSLPQYCGEAPFDVWNSPLAAPYTRLTNGFRKNQPLLKKDHPTWKNMIPWGDPDFAIPFLTQKDIEPLVDGVLYDTGVFDRVPETQMHQCVIHRLWQFHKEWAKYSKRKPLMVAYEGPCYGPVTPGCLTAQQAMEYNVRTIVLLAGYGFRHQFSAGGGPSASDYWGEQHYGGGAIGTMPLCLPGPGVAAFSAAVRHLRPSKFLRQIPFKNLSVYGAEFENIETHKKFAVVWSTKGSYTCKPGKDYEIYDIMDNEVANTGTLTVTTSPMYLYGMTKPEEELVDFTPDHSDAEKDPFVKSLADFSTKNWKQIKDTDDDYRMTSPSHIRRFPAEMVLADENGLAVTLPPQTPNRGTMPNYTTLVPAKPLKLEGVPDSLIFDVTGCGDWGRIVVVLKDGEGKKWISTGPKNNWNCDDTKQLASLNFTGRRPVRIPLPQNSPWDKCILGGTASWGCFGNGKNPLIAVYPLTLEKIYLERREQFIQVNEMRKVTDPKIILHSVSVGYASEAQTKNEALRIASLRMPSAPGVKLPNPIAEMKAKADASLIPGEVVSVSEPETYNDGTNGIFKFKVPAEAVSFDLWLSTSPDGAGALCMGRNMTKPEAHIRGFRAETDFYAFIVYRTKDKKTSVTVKPFKFRMQKNFGKL